jgi:D-alanyl-D-alanine dipeptidase
MCAADIEDRFAVHGGCGTTCAHLRFLGYEAVVFDDLAERRQRDCVAWFQLENRQAFVQAHAYVLNAVNLQHGHAHGVSADLSIHSERLDFDVAEFGMG